ncbi:glycosyl transferase group 1 [Thiocapsa marina 5811]|uniref:GDP-Man:Man(1)GlcNAc(2)-PP-Dol alpha-1,3-mannosyltransferase n=2 Tax=Thiocapsa marina TaxID=244573 RepID=F9U9B0_9GAMM|nr:glycosyl transferase group 1 [Thiocapsa marina 5811]
MTLYGAFDADVCVGFVSQHVFGDAIDPGRLIDLRAHSRFPPLELIHLLARFQRIAGSVARYPNRIYSGSYSVLASSPDHSGRSIYYCHTPPRFLYDLEHYYLSRLSPLQRPLLRALQAWFKSRYEASISRMDVVLANSRNVQHRLKHYVDVESTVVYPPVDLSRFRWSGQDDYFVSTARLEPLKRVAPIIEAFRQMPDQTLVVASGGGQLKALRRLAANASNIHFTGWLAGDELSRLIGSCRASIYLAQDEDFGISPVESMAAGKPVIGVAEGGLLETLVPDETGHLLPPSFTVEDIRGAVRSMTAAKAKALRASCETRAALFSREAFLSAMGSTISPASPPQTKNSPEFGITDRPSKDQKHP